MANAKRVLLLVTSADWGGVQAFLLRFAIDLKGQGIEVLLAAGGEGRLWEEAKKAGIPARQLRHMEREISPLHDLSAIAELRGLITEFKPDAVHLNSSKMGVVGSVACALSRPRPRTVYRIGGWAFLENLPPWKKSLYLRSEQWTARFKDIIITVHPGDEKIAHERHIVPRQGLWSVPNGLPEDFSDKLLSREEARRSLDLPQDAFVFGTVANAYPPKALPAYVRSLDAILEGVLGAHAIIVGGGPGLRELEQIVAGLKNRDRIRLAGERTDSTTLYLAFDAFVLPSEKEGMPWALLEAMTAGLPCIATDVGACRWMLLEQKGPENEPLQCGHIIPPYEVRALRDAMNDLLLFRDKNKKLGEQAAFVAKKYFRWGRTSKDMLDALNGDIPPNKNTR